ncbi:MAG: O-antigen polysaccharide polymerase Wzy [Prevotella sp.]|nr:O-antigen polysaccharide polymerase Wzy [Prevotella sp.]
MIKKNIHIVIVLLCIFANFWASFFLSSIGWQEMDRFIVSPNKYFSETVIELERISIALMVISILFIIRNNKNNDQYSRNIKKYVCKNVGLAEFVFWGLIVMHIMGISFDNSLRGVGQFELSKRGGMTIFFSQIVHALSLPFILFLLYMKPFKRKNTLYLIILLAVYVLDGVSGGGRRALSYMVISLSIFFCTFKPQEVKMYKSIPILILFVFLYGLSLNLRRMGGDVEDIQQNSIEATQIEVNSQSNGMENTLQNSISAFLKTNSDPSFLWGVKEYKELGITMQPIDFLYHFTSIFLPSSLYVMLMGKISYTRSVFLFDYWFNDNPNQGYDFMVLADFYWCFGKIGYFLYVLVFAFILWYYQRNIRSGTFWRSMSAILIILYFCQQRNDFGAVLKPFVYETLILILIQWFFIRKETFNNVIHLDK